MSRFTRPRAIGLAAGILLVAIFCAMVARFRKSLRDEIRQTIISRDASVLLPVAQRQLATRAADAGDPADLLAAVLESAKQEDMLAVAIFDAQGRTIRYAPGSLLFPELPMSDFIRLLKFEPISRFSPEFPLNSYFSGFPSPPRTAPVLEVLLPLHSGNPQKIVGFAQYLIDGRSLAAELEQIDRRINRQTEATLGIGAALIAAVVAAAGMSLRGAQRTIAERTARLARANVELTLAAKASAIGQVTSNLVHGLQGPVASLRGLAASRQAGEAAPSDWRSVGGYAQNMQAMIQDAVALLRDSDARTSFDLTGAELAEIVRDRNMPAAQKKGVRLDVSQGFVESLDSQRGGLLCLIAGNLVQNAIEATAAGRKVAVDLRRERGQVRLVVSDEGPGIPPERQDSLFEPGVSSREGGTGLGLALSHLMARQVGAHLELQSTGPEGTTFCVILPCPAA
ncbi:MAG TPA: sensor histidine kinase [Opitutaceae bacterium]|jgi:signal transduction histidine kinase